MGARAWHRTRRIAAAIPVLAALALGSCTEVETETHAGYEPSSIKPVKGPGELKQVTFTSKAAKRTGLQTGRVGIAAGQRIVPYEALIYDPEGTTYVYATAGPLEFVRVPIGVERIDGDRVFLSRGPVAGRRVVTVGATEVYGAELEIAASH